jgi:hypothetical protein
MQPMKQVLPQVVREARLRTRYAHLYPFLPRDVWLPAARVAEEIMRWVVWGGGPGFRLPDRVLNEDHFEFRGGLPRPLDRRATRQRVQDRRAAAGGAPHETTLRLEPEGGGAAEAELG